MVLLTLRRHNETESLETNGQVFEWLFFGLVDLDVLRCNDAEDWKDSTRRVLALHAADPSSNPHHPLQSLKHCEKWFLSTEPDISPEHSWAWSKNKTKNGSDKTG